LLAGGSFCPRYTGGRSGVAHRGATPPDARGTRSQRGDQGLKLLEGHTGDIQELRGAGLQIGEPYTGHRRCLLSWEAQYTINRDKLNYGRPLRRAILAQLAIVFWQPNTLW